jgi:hypothetical protein
MSNGHYFFEERAVSQTARVARTGRAGAARARVSRRA